MKTVVQLELFDDVELKALADFTNVIEKYRAGGFPGQQQQAPVQDEAIVGSIDPEIKPVKPTELQEAAQAYAKRHGLDAALKIVKEFGATRVGEIKDPKMMSALYERFTK